MSRLIKWNLEEENFKRAKKSLVNNEIICSDYIGSVEIGELSVDLILRDYDVIRLDFDVFVGGMDQYSHTCIGGLPYDLADGDSFYNEDIINIESIDDFKEYALSVVDSYIEASNYKKEGFTLIDKANSDKFFDWK